MFGVKLVWNLAAWHFLGWTRPELQLGFERYVRTNDLNVNIYSSGVAFRF